MVRFRVSLNLHNINLVNKYSKHKTGKILKFYRALALMIKQEHNLDIKRTQRQFKEYCEPLIKIRKNIFTETTAKEGHPISSIIGYICPPSIDIDIEFSMTSDKEAFALRQFYTDYKGSIKRTSYRELKTLYYSTKIIQFVNNLRGLMNENILWVNYLHKSGLNTKYKPVISVSDAAVLSLH